MKNIHILSTDKPSNLFEILQFNFVLNNQNMYYEEYKKLHKYKDKNIYITSDKEITIGYYLDLADNSIVKITLKDLNKFKSYDKIQFKKIILTTDQDLIKDGVQAIDDEFLEWFVKNPSCEEVEVIPLRKSSGYYDEKDIWHWDFLAYKIIIPKEEQCTCKEHDPYCCQIHGNCPTCVKKEELKQENCCTPLGQIKRYEDCYGCDRKPKQEKLTYTESAKKEERISNSIMMKRKQETLEEVAERYEETDFNITPTVETSQMMIQRAFINGAKWQQERSQQIIPFDAYNIEVFAIKPDENGKLFAYIGYKIANGNFHFNVVPFTEPQQERSYSEEDMNQYSDYVLMCSAEKTLKIPLPPKEWFEQFKKKTK